MAEKDVVRGSYDELASVYAAQRGEGGLGMAVLEEFLESLDGPGSVLDAGCGQGAPVLRRLTASVSRSRSAVGLDFSREQLRLAATNAPAANLVAGDLTDLPFADGAFDGVAAYWSVIHVPLDEHQAVIDEFARVLRPGGRVLVCEGTNEWVGENPDWLDSGVEMQWEIAGADATRDQLRNAGFRVEDSYGVPETLEEDDAEEDDADQAAATDRDGDEEADDGDDGDDRDEPWTFFVASLPE